MANIKIASLTVGELAVNCWLLGNEDTKEALVIDPGDSAQMLAEKIRRKGLRQSEAAG